MENANTSGKLKLKTTNVAAVDALLIAGLLAVVNLATTGWKDWGWMGLNPSPWLLVPLFMGARYGFNWGVTSGLAVAAAIFLGRAGYAIRHDEQQPLAAIFTQNLYFFLILPGIGFLTGETQGLLSRRLRRTESRLGDSEHEGEKLKSELEVAEEARFQLQERLALFGAEQCSLDRQLRGLFEPTAGAIFPNLLRLLRDMAGLTDAAIYAVDGQKLNRIALIGDSSRMPESLFAGEMEIAALAMERRCLTTVKDLWQESPGQNGTFIAALPWLGAGSGVAALLLIHRMHFLGATWRNFSRIQMVCRWVAQFVALRVQAAADPAKLAGSTGALIVSERALQSTLNQALATHREWRLPSTLAVFEFTESVPETIAKLLPQAVGSVMRPTDVGSFAAAQDKPVFKVLMPMDGVSDAEALLERALSAISKVPQLAGKVVANLSMTDEASAVSA